MGKTKPESHKFDWPFFPRLRLIISRQRKRPKMGLKGAERERERERERKMERKRGSKN
jgi:hypothetical protein